MNISGQCEVSLKNLILSLASTIISHQRNFDPRIPVSRILLNNGFNHRSQMLTFQKKDVYWSLAGGVTVFAQS